MITVHIGASSHHHPDTPHVIKSHQPEGTQLNPSRSWNSRGLLGEDITVRTTKPRRSGAGDLSLVGGTGVVEDEARHTSAPRGDHVRGRYPAACVALGCRHFDLA